MASSTIGTIIAYLLLLAVGRKCPPETSTFPCTCEKDGDLTLKCRDLTNSEVLDEVSRRTARTHFQSFELYDSGIRHVPARESVRKMAISNCSLATLFDTRPRPSNILQTLSLQSVTFGEGFPWEQFENLKSLKVLFLNKVRIGNLDGSFSRHVNEGLTYLVMWRTGTMRIEDRVLEKFRELRDVWIEESEIRTLKRSFFPPSARIETLHFNGNLIEFLPDDIFEDMPRLTSIGLSRNRLSQVSEKVFGKVYDQLRMLTLSDNPIYCDLGIKWITTRRKRPYVDGRCQHPKILENRLIRSLEERDFTPTF